MVGPLPEHDVEGGRLGQEKSEESRDRGRRIGRKSEDSRNELSRVRVHGGVDDVLGISDFLNFFLRHEHLLVSPFAFLLLVDEFLGVHYFAVRKEKHAKIQENLRWVLTLVKTEESAHIRILLKLRFTWKKLAVNIIIGLTKSEQLSLNLFRRHY